MRYLLLRQDARRDCWQVVFTDGVDVDVLWAGIPMSAPGGPARVTVASTAGHPSDFLEVPCPIVSDAMRRALDAAGVDNVEYFPAEVEEQHAEGVLVAHYWIANVVGAVACAESLPTTPSIAQAAQPADDEPPPNFRVDPARARGLDLFRLAEDRSLLVVSERVADRLRAAGLRGLVLQAPEEYDGRRVNTAPPQPQRDLGSAPIESEFTPGA